MTTALVPGSTDDALIDAAAARAWPARERLAIGPWIARWNGGYTRRANSLAVLGSPSVAEVPALVDQAEAFYRAHRTGCRVQLAATARTAGVADELAARGYATEPGSVTLVRAASTRSLRLVAPPSKEGRVLIAEGPSNEWLERWWEFLGDDIDEEGRTTLTELLWDIPSRCGFATYVVDGMVNAIGLGVVDGDLLGLFCGVTATPNRRRGNARRILGGLATWGLAHAAKTVYLQVAANNDAGVGFTSAVGFETAYTYRYLLAP